MSTEADLYLPIGEPVIRQIIGGGADNLEKAISSLDIPQIASLLLLQGLPERKNKRSTYHERFLANIIEVLEFQSKRNGIGSVRTEVVPNLNFKNIDEGHNLLRSFRIALLDDGVIRDRNYLTSEAKWDYKFTKRHREKLKELRVKLDNDTTLTLEQSRIHLEICAQIDDHIHVQGYAGTGKSFLIKHLISLLDKKGIRVLILAARQTQINALKSAIGQMEHVFIKTFAGLAYEIIPPDLTNYTNMNMWKKASSRVIMADSEIIKYFDIKTSSKFSPDFIVQIIHSTLARFCYSGDISIQLSHIPNVALFEEKDKQVVLYYSKKLWDEILNPTSKDIKLPISGYHRLKLAALNSWPIPGRYTHILIDECHDLSKPILQILDCSPQAVISLGDEYQNLQGRSQQRSHIIRHREVTESVRSGCLIENIVNPIIAIHPGKTKAPFHGNQSNSLEITYYNKPEIPENPAAILVNDMWELFEWAQRTTPKVSNVSLLTKTKDLNMFVNDCIELYLGGKSPRHWDLFRFKSWDKVASYYHNHQSFQKIDQMFRQGYQYKDWEKTLAKFTESNPNSYLLGRVEDVRNHEFQAVMITPEVICPVWQANPNTIGAVGSAIYVAVTRAKQRLIIPEELRNWIEEITVS